MPISSSEVTVATTATLIASGRDFRDPVTVALKGPSATIFLGGANVTPANGLPIGTTDSFSVDLGPGDTLFAIASGSPATVRTLITRQ